MLCKRKREGPKVRDFLWGNSQKNGKPSNENGGERRASGNLAQGGNGAVNRCANLTMLCWQGDRKKGGDPNGKRNGENLSAGNDRKRRVRVIAETEPGYLNASKEGEKCPS